MTATFNHIIIPAKSPEDSASYYRNLLEIDDAPSWGPFVNLIMTNGVLLQLAAPPKTFDSLHFAFLVDDEHFDRALASLVESQTDYWADPRRSQRNKVAHEDDGRRFYVLDPAGHLVELLTRPYV
ncbi:VOC family protein [Nesterenkonia halotolerans]|uniref:VOC family protein n=1 Tax=Nesterenkonia halotolerans TaxID=225325 RepID=UPI003EE732BE